MIVLHGGSVCSPWGAHLYFPLLVNVKWGKEKFDAVELNTEEPPMVFKAQLFALTGVQPDRQKVMVKGGTLKVQMATSPGATWGKKQP